VGGVLHGQPGQRPCVHRVPGPVGGDDDPYADVAGTGRLGGRVEQQLGEGGDAAVHGGETGRVGLQLQPARALRPLVFSDLPHQPVQVIGRAQHRPGRVVEALETEPAPLVGGGQLGRPFLGERGGQGYPVPLCQLDQRRVTHRTGQVQVKVRLGKGRQIMRHSPLSLTRAGIRWRLRS
jgi:hypothetical protein